VKRTACALLVAILALAVYPQPVEAIDILDAVFISPQFDQGTKLLGITCVLQKKAADGRVAFGLLGALGPAQNGGGIQGGVYLLEGGKFELLVLGDLVAEWLGDAKSDELDNYIRGAHETYAIYNPSPSWGLFFRWGRLYPLTDNRLSQDNLYSIGVKIAVE